MTRVAVLGRRPAWWLDAGLLIGFCAVSGYAGLVHRAAAPPEAQAATRALFASAADSLDIALGRLSESIGDTSSRASGAPSDESVRLAFRESRLRYKHIEPLAEFYAPALAAALNSRRQEVDDDDAPPPSSLAPAGFPALEILLNNAAPLGGAARADARRIVEGMRPVVARLRAAATAIVPTDAQLIELARHELTRVSTLGVAGFDAPRTGAAMVESADALDGVAALFSATGEFRWPRLNRERRALASTLVRAASYLRQNPDFDRFDRLAFIVGYADPAARALDALRRATRTIPVQIPRGWRFDAASVYAAGAFDPRAYAPPSAPLATPALVALGRRLFSEPKLSGTGTRACSSCHDPSRGLSDGLARAATLDGRGRVARHTPGLINAALQPAQFLDERAVTLEDQVFVVLRSPTEMASSDTLAAAALARTAAYREAFAGAFGGDPTVAITPLRVRQALAAFERTLIGLDSRFDRAVRGDAQALTAEERRGFDIFMGKAACGTCHFAPLFSGNTPPLYRMSDVEVIGTPVSPSHPARVDPDSGRMGIDRLPLHLRAFKTPTVRNAALTAPYMHNGAFRTLDEVVAFYDGGGAQGAGAALATQTLAADSLRLSAAERQALVAFMRALTDTAALAGARAPPRF